MFLQIWAGLMCPAMAIWAGYILKGNMMGAVAGVMAYSACLVFSAAHRQSQRQDYWASKLAMLKAETHALNNALAEEDEQGAAGRGTEHTRATLDAYRARLALLQASGKALRAGYASYKSAGVLSHWSEKKGGLLPDGA